MSVYNKLREAAEKSAKTNFDVYAQLASRRGMTNGERMEVASAGLGVGGMLGVMGSAMAVQSATISAGGGLLTTLGHGVIAAGTIAGGVYTVPAIALGAAAIGAVGMLASKLVKQNEVSKEFQARDRADDDPYAKKVTAIDWVRGLKDMVSRSIREAFAPREEKSVGRFFEAVRAGNTEAVRQMVQSNPDLIRSFSDKGASPLAMAIARKHTSVAEVLFQSGARLDDRAHRDRTYNLLNVAASVGDLSYRNLIEAMSVHHGSENQATTRPVFIRCDENMLSFLSAQCGLDGKPAYDHKRGGVDVQMTADQLDRIAPFSADFAVQEVPAPHQVASAHVPLSHAPRSSLPSSPSPY